MEAGSHQVVNHKAEVTIHPSCGMFIVLFSHFLHGPIYNEPHPHVKKYLSRVSLDCIKTFNPILCLYDQIFNCSFSPICIQFMDEANVQFIT